MQEGLLLEDDGGAGRGESSDGSGGRMSRSMTPDYSGSRAASKEAQQALNGTTKYMYFCTIFDTIGGLTFGFDTGVIGGVIAMDDFRDQFGYPRKVPEQDDESWVDVQLGLIVALLSAGCFFGAVAAGPIADGLGRRIATIVGAMLATVGGALLTAATMNWELFVGRVVAGLGIGILSVTVPLYNAEVSPSNIRGRLVSFHQLSITFGIMLAFIVNIPLAGLSYGWRISLGLQCLFSAILMFGAPFLPESPRYLVAKSKADQAEAVLRRLRGVRDVSFELGQIRTAVAEHGSQPVSCGDLFRAGMWRRLVIGVGLMILSQLTGINVVIYYAPIIFSNLGTSLFTTTSIIGVINFLCTFVAIYALDRAGRKPLLLAGAIGMFVSMLVAASLLTALDQQLSSTMGYVVAVFICLYTASFAATWGPGGWVVVSELYPLRVRGKALGLSSASNWIVNTGFSFVTPVLLNSETGLGTAGTFFLIAGFLGACVIFVILAVPETKRKTLEEIDDIFKEGNGFIDIAGLRRLRCCRAGGASYTRLLG